ncbi:MAG TPA: endopeptidase La [Polyangiaceae bacterium LLY-WYZ-15_(1-7)]|nr:endopeptidase La [Myxococcales bacterium]MAT23407.1 endopeptidase La [Sandaracinus sp.]HJK91757.1 endopeptidase La [Polyangiaceae bacterium LLY-WYZ-15_(1-7)]MBJ75139.1 endopeptidase La [Sandaracinus sp.]HJL04632.1 endopeptidase La [Polyangiaceae bacterium LLY-WYZ-15_(1-7)]
MFFHKNDEGEKKETEGKRGKVVPLLPLRDIIVFPHMVVPLFVGREKSINALEEAMSHEKEILLAAQKKAKTNDPTPDDIFQMGTVGTIIQLLRLPDGTVKVLVEGKRRARIQRFIPNEEFFLCEVENVAEESEAGVEVEALMRSVQSTFETYVKLNKRIPPEMLMTVQTIDDPSRLADTIVVHLTSIKLNDRQEILETTDPGKRLERLFELMNNEIEILQVEKKIRSRVKKQMEKSQKEYYLNEQMQAIQKELGERDEFKSEIQEIEEKLKTKKLSKEALTKVKKELKKLKMMQPMSAEATVVRNYIDWVLALPWYDKSDENYDIDKAEEILDEDHYGLKKPKERILEYLAVQALVKKLKGPVLCLVGPPGVGKTSLARSIARATGREFVRLSLGGVRDEAEIRGHRRTYIGALPGRLIQSLRKVGTNNPVFLLDEIDKMSSDFRGDPASALLEVLDPEQNSTFNDHYLDLDYDLSDVMFITTANALSGIPLPLRDRMEILELSGYTEFEKLNIAVRYLVPRQLKAAGLEDVDVELTENAIRTVIHHYTKESGVRNLEREIGSVCRKIARRVLKEGKDQTYRVAAKSVPQYLGVPKFRPNKANDKDLVGLTNGLAYTSVGGTILECEVAVVPGKGKLVITGLLEKGMQESAQAAMSYIRSRHKALGLEEDFHEKYDVHVHFPEFVPKDGPSAGITMATSIASALLKIPVRRNVAMTGEITLRGRVMPIGGLKEKMLAAHRAGIDTILIPRENRKDLREIPKRVLTATRVVLVEHMDQVLSEALVLSDPEALFGAGRQKPLEYRQGKLIEPEKPASVREPTVDAPGPQQ